MTMMTPITRTPLATSIRHPSMDRAERLAACKTVVVEMLAEAAKTLDFAKILPVDFRSAMYVQARLRMTRAALLLAELDNQGEDAGRTIMSEIIDIADTPDPDLVRDIATHLDAAFGIELHQINIGMSWDRYET